jgi:hypothetical protein
MAILECELVLGEKGEERTRLNRKKRITEMEARK